MAMVDMDGSCQFLADSQPKSTGLVQPLGVGGHRALSLHSLNAPRVNSCNDFGYDDRTINIVVVIIIIIIVLLLCK